MPVLRHVIGKKLGSCVFSVKRVRMSRNHDTELSNLQLILRHEGGDDHDFETVPRSFGLVR